MAQKKTEAFAGFAQAHNKKPAQKRTQRKIIWFLWKNLF